MPYTLVLLSWVGLQARRHPTVHFVTPNRVFGGHQTPHLLIQFSCVHQHWALINIILYSHHVSHFLAGVICIHKISHQFKRLHTNWHECDMFTRLHTKWLECDVFTRLHTNWLQCAVFTRLHTNWQECDEFTKLHTSWQECDVFTKLHICWQDSWVFLQHNPIPWQRPWSWTKFQSPWNTNISTLITLIHKHQHSYHPETQTSAFWSP